MPTNRNADLFDPNTILFDNLRQDKLSKMVPTEMPTHSIANRLGFISMEAAVNYLNELLEADRAAISKVFMSRSPWNEELVNNTSCVCVDINSQSKVSPLGVLNGLFNTIPSNNGKRIEAIIELAAKPPVIVKFRIQERKNNEQKDWYWIFDNSIC